MNSSLEAKAIELALSKEWNRAIEVNKKILEKYPKNVKALLRLGKALIHTKEYKGATEAFLKVLKKDRINRIAKKNLENIKQKANTSIKV